MPHRFMRAFVVALACLLAVTPTRSAAAQFAVIVHPTAGISDVSLEELRRVFGGRTPTFGGAKVQVVEYTKLRRGFYRTLLDLAEDDVRRRWIALIFRGESATPPRELADPVEVRRYVADHPGAISFVEASAVDGSVRALLVNGRKPSDSSYPLR